MFPLWLARHCRIKLPSILNVMLQISYLLVATELKVVPEVLIEIMHQYI